MSSAEHFIYAENKLDSYLTALAGSLIDIGYGVQGQLFIQGWDDFVSKCDDKLIAEFDLFEERVDVEAFLNDEVGEDFVSFCDAKDIYF